MKRARVTEVVERWCGRRPARGSDKLQELWEENGPSGVPFDDEGAERLIRELDSAFPGHRLRPVDVLGLTFDGSVDAVPDDLVEAPLALTLGARGAAPEASNAKRPVVVTLADETIERLATRIAQLLRPGKNPVRPTSSKVKQSVRKKATRS